MQMEKLMSKVAKTEFLVLFILSIGVLTVSCSQAPVSFIKQSAGELALVDRFRIKRQRQFTISTLSRIGVLYETSGAESATNLTADLLQAGAFSFEHAFSSVTRLNSSARTNKVDFVIRARLLDARSHQQEKQVIAPVSDYDEGELKTEGQLSGTPKELLFVKSRIQPFKALMKLELMDARTARILDTAIVEGRSGLVGSLAFDQLLKQSLKAYSDSISTGYNHYF